MCLRVVKIVVYNVVFWRCCWSGQGGQDWDGISWSSGRRCAARFCPRARVPFDYFPCLGCINKYDCNNSTSIRESVWACAAVPFVLSYLPVHSATLYLIRTARWLAALLVLKCVALLFESPVARFTCSLCLSLFLSPVRNMLQSSFRISISPQTSHYHRYP